MRAPSIDDHAHQLAPGRRRPRRWRNHERDARLHHPTLEPTWTIHIYERLDERRPGELQRVEQRRHRARRPVRAQLHAGEGRRLDRHHQGRRDQRAVPDVARVLELLVDRRPSARGAELHRPDAAHDLRPRCRERRLPATPARRAASHPLFADLEFSDDPDGHRATWAPAAHGRSRPDEPVAATRAPAGTDVDFGALTRSADRRPSSTRGAAVHLEHEVTSLRAARTARWRLKVRDRRWNAAGRAARSTRGSCSSAPAAARCRCSRRPASPRPRATAASRSAGSSCAPPTRSWSRSTRRRSTARPTSARRPMSVPHLDTRVVDGQTALLFGPYAGFSTQVPQAGARCSTCSVSIRPRNIVPMLAVAKDNLDLMRYLVSEVTASRRSKLRRCGPSCRPPTRATGSSITAGQRVQVIKSDPDEARCPRVRHRARHRRPTAPSPACSAPPRAPRRPSPTMVDLLDRCFPERAEAWRPLLPP